jgi:serine-threonine kinase receptor-associated protein
VSRSQGLRGYLLELNTVLFRWWDLRTRKLSTSLNFHSPITSMELSPQTKRLVVTSGTTVAFVPALPNGSPTHSLALPYSPSSASVHPILQDRFVTGNLGDEWVRVHGMDGEEREVLKGHHGPVHCVEFSPDGEMYASGSGKCSLTLYHTRCKGYSFDMLFTSTIIRGRFVYFFAVSYLVSNC